MRNAWFFRSLAVLAAASFLGAIALSRWAREQPMPLPPDPEAADAPADRVARVTPLPELVGRGPEELIGSVVDFGGGAIADVAVMAFPDGAPAEGAQPSARATTGADGGFALRGLEAGVYRLSVDGDSVFPADVRFVDVPGRPARLTVARRVSIEGTVTDGGQPAPAVTVAVSGGASAGVTTVAAGDGGRFELPDLIEGEYQVWAYSGDRAARVVAVQRLGAGPFEPVALAMEPAWIVHGRIFDAATGRGLEADVMLTDAGGVEPARYGRSAADGSFAIEGVPAGSWIPDARADGYIATELLAFEPERIGRLDIRLVRGGIARGRVVDGAGVAVPGVAVSLHGEDLGGQPVVVSAAARSSTARRFRGEGFGTVGARFIPRGELGVVLGPIPFPPPPGGRAALPQADPIEPAPPAVGEFVTGADGRYRIEGLRPGRYVAHLLHPDYAPGRSAAFSVQLDGGRELTTVLVPGLVVYGDVRDRGGAPVVGATVSAESGAGDTPVAISVTGTDGRYQLQPIARDVTLRVTAAGYGPATRTVRLGKLGRERERREERFELIGADASIAGRVVDPRGRAVAGAVVVAYHRNVATDTYGRFLVVGVPPGRHELVVTHPDYPPVETTAPTDGETDIALAQGGGIELDVRDRHTTADIAAARVTARGPGGARHTPELRDGRAVLAPLRVGKWTIDIDAVGYVPERVVVDVPAGDGPRAVSVSNLRVELERGATVAGIVRDSHGERVAGAVVRCGEAKTKTNRDGNFRLTDVKTGDVEVAARRGAAEGSTRVPLRPGDEVTTLDIRIE